MKHKSPLNLNFLQKDMMFSVFMEARHLFIRTYLISMKSSDAHSSLSCCGEKHGFDHSPRKHTQQLEASPLPHRGAPRGHGTFKVQVPLYTKHSEEQGLFNHWGPTRGRQQRSSPRSVPCTGSHPLSAPRMQSNLETKQFEMRSST